MRKVLLGLPEDVLPDIQKETNILWNQNLGFDPFVGQLVEKSSGRLLVNTVEA